MTFLPITEYCPDMAAVSNNFSDEVENVLPGLNSYNPFPAFQAFSQPLPGKPFGMFAFGEASGSVHTFVGTENKIYALNKENNNWEDVSRLGKAYEANESSRWSFALFGHCVIAVNKNDAPQILKIGESNRFCDLKGEPPRAGIVKVWGDFVCFMQLPDFPNRVHWSGLRDVECWEAGKKNCDYQDFSEGGEVQGSTESADPIIFTRSAIYYGHFIPGSPVVFSFKKIYAKKGVKSPLSIACRGDYAFFVDEGGFCQISSNGVINEIGLEKVNATIFSKVNSSNLASMQAAIDPINSRVYWLLDDKRQRIGTTLLIYDWNLQRWSRSNVRLHGLLSLFMQGDTLEGLDKVSPHLESLPYSLDSKIWQNGSPVLGAISEDYRLGFFNGPPMEATICSAQYMAPHGRVQTIRRVLPLLDTQECALSIGKRYRFGEMESFIWGEEARPSYNTGFVNARARGRFLKLKLRIPPAERWSRFTGFEVEFKDAGKR